MAPTKPGDHDSSERTPLLNGNGEGSNTTTSANGGHRHHQPTSGSNLKHFLLNKHYTPGTEHHSLAVRSAAYTWHVTKVTILSSMLITPPPPN